MIIKIIIAFLAAAFLFIVEVFLVSMLAYTSRLSITDRLIRKAQRKHRGKEIIPFWNKLYDDCRVDQDGRHELHYHVKGDKSSHMVWIKDRSIK